MSTFREDFVSATSHRGDRDVMIQGEYDLAIFASGWDRRALSLMKAENWRAKRGVLIIPPIRDVGGLCAEHEKALMAGLAERCTKWEVIDGPTLNFDGVWDQLYKIGLGQASLAPISGKVLLDVSAMSRYYSTGLVAMIIRLGLASRIDCFYAEGKYDAKQDIQGVLFSDGGWERKTVPFLDGRGNPSLGWYYLVAAGFDGPRIKKILMQEEPDRVGLLVPIPGVVPAYEEQCLKAIAPVVQEFMVSEEYQTQAHAADAVGAWQKLTGLDQEKWDEEQVAYLCCGTKPHALALALRAIVHRSPMVLYFLPESYTVISVEEAGVFWRYSITDHSVLRADSH